ncbi:inositol monophosphatase family protein [Litchfieldella xinjiangensis]|uniref:inositol monophosphatase family protein n=1 Tax=Litchfieldella xinjiangensis TaxID=1166948 RepID=UPI0006938EFA|nr:inositol monophosphatase family protein [Halomonas xinjiangensis]
MLSTRENALAEVVKQAARDAGAILLEGYRERDPMAFERKGASDFVTHYDRAAEQAIIATVRGAFPEVSFLGEESGELVAEGSEYTVIIDPLDGTNNFVHKIPHFSVSIAVYKGHEAIIGVVHQPVLDEMLWACRGEGAYLNHERLPSPPARELSAMLVSTCFPYHGKGDCGASSREVSRLMPHVAGIRSPGSAALEIAYVALGRFDAFWNSGAKLELWDIAAGMLIAREAGCTVTDLTGECEPDAGHSLIIAPPHRHADLLALLTH